MKVKQSETIASLVAEIQGVTGQFDEAILAKIDNKTKPPGALGRLESLALQLAKVQACQKGGLVDIDIALPTIMVFAADHGIASHGISIAPQAVTRQMVLNFLAKGAAINCFCQANDVALKVVDCGILVPIEANDDNFYQSRMASGTRDFSNVSAMTESQMQQAIIQGAELVNTQVALGSNVLGFGEMGIGNTTSAAALLCALTQGKPVDLVGLGTGIDDSQLALKINLIEQALARVDGDIGEPLTALTEFGGFEIAHMVGAMLAVAKHQRVILVDGFIVSVAAMLACQLAPKVRDYMVFCHASAEKSHRLVLKMLAAQPLLDLDMRLGEGTAGALALPLLRSSAAFYNHMASFESANVVL